jgi:hypothetical protein
VTGDLHGGVVKTRTGSMSCGGVGVLVARPRLRAAHGSGDLAVSFYELSLRPRSGARMLAGLWT